ncbi:hypothetical protein HPG69_016598, partial [Diceros bicornis minor]
DEGCDHWIRTFVPSSLPGQFYLGGIKRYPGVQSYTVRVVATNYNQYAIVFFKKFYKNQGYFKTTLYGRTKELPPERREEFTRFAKSIGLTDDHIIFPIPIGKAQLGRGEGDMQLSRPDAAPPRKGGEKRLGPLVHSLEPPGSHFGLRETLSHPGVCGARRDLGPKCSSLTGSLGLPR